MNEMAIHKHIEYDDIRNYGRIDVRNRSVSDDNLDIVKECIMLMVVCVNANWKLPVKYFFSSKSE